MTKEIKKYTLEEQKEIDKAFELAVEYASPRVKLEFIEAIKPVKEKIDALWEKIANEEMTENPNYNKIQKWKNKIDELYLEGSEKSCNCLSDDVSITPGT